MRTDIFKSNSDTVKITDVPNHVSRPFVESLHCELADLDMTGKEGEDYEITFSAAMQSLVDLSRLDV